LDNTSVLGIHLDGLTVSASRDYELPVEKTEEWRAAKSRLQEAGDRGSRYELGEASGVPGGPFMLFPTGRGKYQFKFENERFYVEATVWRNMPSLIIQPKAILLYEYPDYEALGTLCRRVAEFFLDAPVSTLLPSRVDVAVDFQGADFVPPERRDICTAARKVHYDYEGMDAVTVTLGERSNSVQVQLYDKTREIEKSGKDWMLDVWESGGNYREGLQVWRLEVRMYRQWLKEADIDSIESLGDRLQTAVVSLVNFGTNAWVRFLDPVSEGQSNRRALAPWFQTIMSSVSDGWDGQLVKRTPRRSEASLRIAVERIGKEMARGAAIARKVKLNHGHDMELWFNWVRFRLPLMMAREGTSWSAEVEAASAKLPDVLEPDRELVRLAS
jgi:hypothetical protein